ncbi:MAG: helix-turn-helix domain-containing protein [Spirochaetia bacterium]|jgi:AraC-like DNA-binding protein|nr:helix-turn-helix domain-containing protein [Spirochaetia bacterium]
MRILTIIAATGGIHGTLILLSILFRFRHRKNLPLALLLIVFSLRLATIPTWKPEILLSYPWIYPMTSPLPFLFSFLIWWYIRELVSDKLNPPKFLFIHFLPYLLEVLAVSFTLYTMDSGEYELFLNNVFSGNPPLWLPVRNGLKVLVNIIYLVVSGRIAFGKKSERLSGVKRFWIRSLVIIPSIVLTSFAYVAVLPSVSRHMLNKTAWPFLILSITMAVLIYGISFLLLAAPDISFPEYGEHEKAGKCPVVQLCSDIECRYLMDKIEKRFNDGAWQNPDLVISDLASEFKVHPNRLSYAINQCCKVSFRTFLNSKRLEYFKYRIKNGAHKNKSILDLAFEAGFPSKSTFNRLFRENMGMTPSEYVKQSDAAAD